MKGLVLKDSYLIWKMCKAFIFIMLVFVAFSVFSDGNLFFLFYPCIISSALPITLLSYDEQSKWAQYADGLPITRAQLVSSKYLVGLLGNLVVLFLSVVAQICKALYLKSFSAEEFLFLIAILFSVSFFMPALIYPFIFKLGVEKGRIFYYIMIGAACGISSLSMLFDDISGFSIRFSITLLSAILFSATVLLYIASWLLSIRFYQKREL